MFTEISDRDAYIGNNSLTDKLIPFLKDNVELLGAHVLAHHFTSVFILIPFFSYNLKHGEEVVRVSLDY